MANVAEVIELGSSDEETETAPKKKKQKPMVYIPNNIPGMSIKPAKPRINPVSSISKSITVTKVTSGNAANKVANPFANRNKQNGKPVVHKQIIKPSHLTSVIPKISPAVTISPAPIKIAKGVKTMSSLGILPQKALPPGITVKRTTLLQSAVRQVNKIIPIKSTQAQRQIRPPKRPRPQEMVCVDLDDDDAASSSTGPQWYLRPEEQVVKNKSSESKENLTKPEITDVSDDGKEEATVKVLDAGTEETTSKEETAAAQEDFDMEEQNNKEPETPVFIEITIEDSPAKPPKIKRAYEVVESAITINDSPIKGTADEPASTNSSDDETTATKKEKQSKKKLEYSKTENTIEIELTPVGPDTHQDVDNNDTIKNTDVDTEIFEIEESPLKSQEEINTSTPKKKPPKPQPKLNEIKAIPVKSPKKLIKIDTTPTTPGEFTATYQNFIDVCFQLENSDEMKQIVEKRIKSYYRQVPKEYTESEAFIDMVASKITAMKGAPAKMYLYIKDVVDELNMQRKLAKAQPVKLDVVNEEQGKVLYGEESEFDLKRQTQIRKLEKTLKKLHRAIQKLEEQEVDFDDEEDSVYLLTESEEDSFKDSQPIDKGQRLKRYKERIIRVHAKFCQLTNTKMPSEPRVQLDARPGQPKGPAKRLEKWINMKVPIGTPLPFPDFHDVVRCVRDANQEDKIGWNEADVMEEARDLFTRCGKKLQRRRQENEWRLAASRIQSELDPAEESEDLKRKLDSNQRVATAKESEVLNKYADRQNQLNLEAVEIEDKEADESPVDTDDEEPAHEKTSLETKEKRKERLKRLLQEKSRKTTNENEITNESDKSDSVVEKVQDSPDACTKDMDKDNKCPISENKEKENVEAEHLSDELADDKPNDKLADDTTSDKLADDTTIDKLVGEKANYKLVDAKANDKHGDEEEASEEKSNSEKIHLLSDDSNKIDSDIDELHLLQKLRSSAVGSSTYESSDSESAIAISDTLSSGDNKKPESDVISIENSSYSESEKNNEQEFELVSCSKSKAVSESVTTDLEIECSVAGVQKKINQTNNDEYNESVEDILLASSDDETSRDKNESENIVPANEINVDQSKNDAKYENDAKDENKVTTDMHADIIDDSSMDTTETTAVTNSNIIDNIEVTSISSTENGEGETADTCVIASVVSLEVESAKTDDSNGTNFSENNEDRLNVIEETVNKIINNSENGTTSDSNDITENITALDNFFEAIDTESCVKSKDDITCEPNELAEPDVARFTSDGVSSDAIANDKNVKSGNEDEKQVVHTITPSIEPMEGIEPIASIESIESIEPMEVDRDMDKT